MVKAITQHVNWLLHPSRESQEQKFIQTYKDCIRVSDTTREPDSSSNYQKRKTHEDQQQQQQQLLKRKKAKMYF